MIDAQFIRFLLTEHKDVALLWLRLLPGCVRSLPKHPCCDHLGCGIGLNAEGRLTARPCPPPALNTQFYHLCPVQPPLCA